GVKNVSPRIDSKAIFQETGIQFMPLNTIYQLAAETFERLDGAALMLMIADGFNFFLSGVAKVEESNASTSQLYNPRTRQWSTKLAGLLGIPERLFPPIVPSGTRLGPLKSGIAREAALPALEVIAGGSHDTAA